MLPGIPGRDGIVRGSYCWNAQDFTPAEELSKSYVSVTEA